MGKVFLLRVSRGETGGGLSSEGVKRGNGGGLSSEGVQRGSGGGYITCTYTTTSQSNTIYTVHKFSRRYFKPCPV